MGSRSRDHRDHHKCRSSAKPWGQLQMMAHRTPLCQQLQACWVQKSPPRCCPSVSSTRYKTSCFTATVKSTGKNPWACLQESHPAVLLLPQVTAVSLICENFCSAALITARPNYRGRELPSQPQMAWPSKARVQGHPLIPPKVPKTVILQCMH